MTRPQTDTTHQPSVEKCAQMGRPFLELPYDPDEALRQIWTYFLDQYEAVLTVRRFEQLCFYTDYRYYQLHGEQLTNVNYKPSAYGMRSKAIEPELDNSPFDKTNVYREGRYVDAYDEGNLSLEKHDDDLCTFLEQMHEETREISYDDLVTFSKNVPMFDKTHHDEIADFTDETVEQMDSYPR